MKINPLLYALPALLLTSCFSSDTDSSTGSTAESGSPILARSVVGVHMISTDANYDAPCTIVGEEYLRKTFNLSETVELEEVDKLNGCEFEWAGNKVMISFGGAKPYQSIYTAAYKFDKMYQGGGSAETKAEMAEAMAPKADSMSTETLNAGVSEDSAASNAEAAKKVTLVKPAIQSGEFAPVTNVGDKAVWNASEGTMHVLYNNHIIHVQVETKDKAEVKKERAQMLAEVLIDKIAEIEYAKH